MKVIILAGGRGTRLLPYTTVFPKPLVPLEEKPILEIVIRQLVYYGFTDIILSVGYLSELIQAYFHDGTRLNIGARITYIREPEPLGTVGSLGLVPDLKGPFLVMNGDVLTSLNYAKLIEYHKEKGGLLTIAMNRRSVKIDLGLMEVNKHYELENFIEKPTMEYLVSMGIYVYEPGILDYIPKGGYLDFPDMVLQLLHDKKRVVGYPSEDYWLDLGSHEDYNKALEEFDEKKYELMPWLNDSLI